MAYIGNTPGQTTVLQVEARKSLSLSLRFMDTNRRPADLTGCTVRLVVKALPLDPADVGDADNLIVSSTADLVAAGEGFCRFSVQASELNHAPGEYPFAIVLVNAAGYSSVAAKGVMDVQPNTEFASMGMTFTDQASPVSLDVLMRGSSAIDVVAGHIVPPGFTWMSDADKEKLDGLNLAGNLLPAGGLLYQVLRKASGDDYDFEWVNPQAFDGTLDAAGQPTGHAPVANGDGTWDWAAVSTIVDWNAAPGAPGSVANKPALGTAAAQDVEAFAAAGHQHDGGDIVSGTVAAAYLPRLTELGGVTIGTAVPTGGADGDVHLRYTP